MVNLNANRDRALKAQKGTTFEVGTRGPISEFVDWDNCCVMKAHLDNELLQ